MLESDDGRTSVPEVPANSANCPVRTWASNRKLGCLKKLKLTGEVGLQNADVAQSRDALVGRSFQQAMFDGGVPETPVNDRKNATLLEVERVALALGRNQLVKQTIGVGKHPPTAAPEIDR